MTVQPHPEHVEGLELAEGFELVEPRPFDGLRVTFKERTGKDPL